MLARHYSTSKNIIIFFESVHLVHRQKNLSNFVSRNLKHHNRYCHKARDNAWQIRWYTKYRSRKRKKKDSQKERICRHPQLGRKIITLCLKFFLTPYPNCILEVVEFTELRRQKLVCQFKNVVAQLLYRTIFTVQLLWWATFIACYFAPFFHGDFAMGFCSLFVPPFECLTLEDIRWNIKEWFFRLFILFRNPKTQNLHSKNAITTCNSQGKKRFFDLLICSV